MGKFLPLGVVDSVRLTKWDWATDTKTGRSRRLRYLVYSAREVSEAEIWIVSRGDTDYVNTLRASGPSPLHEQDARQHIRRQHPIQYRRLKQRTPPEHMTDSLS